jgi:hypothetical protein
MTNFVNVQSLTLGEMVSIHNMLTDKPTKKFSDRQSGERRTLKLLGDSRRVVVREDDGSVTVVSDPEYTDVLNVEAEPKVSGTREVTLQESRSPGHARMVQNLGPEQAEALRQKTLADSERALEDARKTRDAEFQQAARDVQAAREARDHAPPVNEKEEPQVPVRRAGRAASIADTDVITVVHKKGDNPKRGTAAKRYSLYRTGMTVAGYQAAIGGDRRLALADINWDRKKGWIKVGSAK